MRRLAITVGTLAAIVVAFIALVWLLQRRMIYIPLVQNVPAAAQVLAGAEEVQFDTGDGLRLNGWFIPAERGSSRATVLVFNGNAGNRSFRSPLAAALNDLGYSVLLFDYRGYGGNPGWPSERGLIADGRAVRGYLETRADVDPDRIVYFGESLGTGVAVALAAERPPAALILRSPFTSLTDVGKLHYPFLPVRALLRDRFASIDRIAGVDSPLLIIAGGSDRIVPASLSRRLYEAAPMRHKQLLLIEGAGHNDYELLAGGKLIRGVASFIDAALDQEDR